MSKPIGVPSTSPFIPIGLGSLKGTKAPVLKAGALVFLHNPTLP